MVEDQIIYRGDTEAERLESAVIFTSLMNFLERMQAGQIYCTSGELRAVRECVNIATPWFVELPQQPVEPLPDEIVTSIPPPPEIPPVPSGPLQQPSPQQQTRQPPGDQNPKQPRRIRQVP